VITQPKILKILPHAPWTVSLFSALYFSVRQLPENTEMIETSELLNAKEPLRIKTAEMVCLLQLNLNVVK